MGKLKEFEAEIMKYKGKMSAYKVAKKYNCSHTAIYKIWKKEGILPSKEGGYIVQEHYNFIYDQGYEQGFIDCLEYLKEITEEALWMRYKK